MKETAHRIAVLDFEKDRALTACAKWFDGETPLLKTRTEINYCKSCKEVPADFWEGWKPTDD